MPRVKDESSSLPDLGRLMGDESLLHRLDIGRFIWGRYLVLAFAWVAAVHHACALALQDESPWPWPACVLMGAVIGGGLTIGARRFALAHGQMKYIAPVLLLILLVADIAWGFPLAVVVSLLMGVTLLVSIIASSQSGAVIGLMLGGISLLMSVIAAIRSLIILVASHV